MNLKLYTSEKSHGKKSHDHNMKNKHKYSEHSRNGHTWGSTVGIIIDQEWP